jgi:hypothetical protein
MYKLQALGVDLTLNVKMRNDKPITTALMSAELLCILKIKFW